MPGRKPKPTALKLLQGNPGKRPLRDDEPRPEVCLPDPPEHLSAVAKEHWGVIGAQLAEAGILTSIDRDALALYCEAYARWVHANEQLRLFGVLVKAPSGYPMQSPFLAIANKAFEQMRSMLTEFGMTPSSRTRVRVASPGAEDPMDEFLRRGAALAGKRSG
jgi:P27 family predicted phage terminase small subunit